ncbi:MAG: ATP-dependent Clp protease adapter ClpS [SAR324 cluster bacterium]|nr:ATP-dependent Clp protease adapter ClpS [SAR324 cluster bacterium]
MGQQNPVFGGQTLNKSDTKLQPPKMFKVLIHNDDYTTMEFVVLILERVFGKNLAEATRVMLNVHNEGVGIGGVYSFEIAETKVAAVHTIAQQYEFPLRCSLEEA